VSKNVCPHCGAWGQLSKFCNRCGNSIIYSSLQEGNSDFENRKVAPSTQWSDVPVIVFFAVLFSIVVAIVLR